MSSFNIIQKYYNMIREEKNFNYNYNPSSSKKIHKLYLSEQSKHYNNNNYINHITMLTPTTRQEKEELNTGYNIQKITLNNGINQTQLFLKTVNSFVKNKSGKKIINFKSYYNKRNISIPFESSKTFNYI